MTPSHGQELCVPRGRLELGVREADPVDPEVEPGEFVLEADHGEVSGVSGEKIIVKVVYLATVVLQ